VLIPMLHPSVLQALKYEVISASATSEAEADRNITKAIEDYRSKNAERSR
jgi:hypothetical protein